MPSKSNNLTSKIDAILAKYTDPSKDGKDKVPFLIAGLTDKDKILYLGSSGLKDVGDANSLVNNDTTIAMYSTSKAVTATLLFQLIENGKISSLDDAVEKYVPEINEIKLIENFEGDEPVLVKPKTKITIRHLVTHTAGFAYAFFDHKYAKLLSLNNGYPNILKAEWDQFTTPLVFEPGSRWEYGVNIDWCGKVIQAVTGSSLDDYLKTHIFDPLGIKTVTYRRQDDHLSNHSKIHFRDLKTGELVASDELHPIDPSFQCGGHGLFGTVRDYLKFLQIFLNEGSASGVQILKQDTVNKYFLQDQLIGELSNTKLETLPAAQPQLTNEVPALPNSSWTVAFQITKVDLPTGRSAGSVNWAGLPNIYYWIDPKKGIAGYYASQFFPFYDSTALQGFQEFETAAYELLDTNQ